MINFELIFGSIELKEYSPRYAEKITRDESGVIIERKPYDPHIVCFGAEYCHVCGRKLSGKS